MKIKILEFLLVLLIFPASVLADDPADITVNIINTGYKFEVQDGNLVLTHKDIYGKPESEKFQLNFYEIKILERNLPENAEKDKYLGEFAKKKLIMIVSQDLVVKRLFYIDEEELKIVLAKIKKNT